MRILRLLLICVFVCSALSAKPKRKPAREGKRGKKRDSLPKRELVLQAESLINIQLVHATYVEIGFSYIQGAEGFLVTAKEWIDGSFEQSVATDTQYLGVQTRSAVLQNLIPGREYLIQVQATSKKRKPFGTIAGKIARTSQKCYVCNGVSRNEDCDKESNVVECPHDKDACANVVRYDNNKMTISKRCAQYNPKLTKACDGKENAKDSACRCMCRSNECNKLVLPCIDECLDELPMPPRSTLRCTNGGKVGSVCKWECDPSYAVKGLAQTICRPDRTWSVLSPPHCMHKPRSVPTKLPPRRRTKRPSFVPKLCKPIVEKNAEVECTAGAKVRSTCTLKCKSGFSREGGSTSRTCGRNLKWTGTPIVCREIQCPSPYEKPGVVECTNDTKIGSICDVRTHSKLTCQSDGSWSVNTARYPLGLSDMEPIGDPCEALEPPRFGDLICTNENQADSLCEYACAKGYAVVGKTPVRECKNGKWTGQPITCEEITCSNLHEKSYVKEVVDCSHGNKIGSVCSVLAPSVVACQSDGTWTLPINSESKCKECTCP